MNKGEERRNHNSISHYGERFNALMGFQRKAIRPY